MVDKIKIRIGNFKDQRFEELTPRELAAKIHKSLAILSKMTEDCAAIDRFNHVSHWWPMGGWKPIPILKAQGYTYLEFSTPHVHWADAAKRDIEPLIEESERCLDIVESGDRPGNWALDVVQESPTRIRLDIIILSVLGCQKCGAVVNQPQLRRHMETSSCLSRAGDLENEPRGWVRVTDHTTRQALIDAGIEHEIRPVATAIWAPKWVSDAAKKYKSGKGYAGMPMKAYLLKVKG